jgi:hypothetical protein
MIPTSQAKRFAAACWFVVCLAPMLARADDDPINIDRLRRPLSPVTEMRTPQFEVDVSEVPDDAYSADWAGQARVLCEDWFPLLCRYMAVEGWKPPEKIRLVVKKNMRAPALRTGSEIHISERWIRQHPDDLGMVIHELTHAIQDYPPGQPGWLVEGIADYIRYWRYEPELPRPRIDPLKAKYREGYGTTAAFLAWIVAKHDRRIILRLDAALRANRYDAALFKEGTGKELDALWEEFLASQGK